MPVMGLISSCKRIYESQLPGRHPKKSSKTLLQSPSDSYQKLLSQQGPHTDGAHLYAVVREDEAAPRFQGLIELHLFETVI